MLDTCLRRNKLLELTFNEWFECGRAGGYGRSYANANAVIGRKPHDGGRTDDRRHELFQEHPDVDGQRHEGLRVYAVGSGGTGRTSAISFSLLELIII